MYVWVCAQGYSSEELFDDPLRLDKVFRYKGSSVSQAPVRQGLRGSEWLGLVCLYEPSKPLEALNSR